MTMFALVGAASAAIWFSVFVVCHVVQWRRGRAHVGWLLRTYAWTLIAAIGGTVAQQIVSSVGPLAASLAAAITVLTSLCLFVLYMPAVYVVLTSVSVQTIVLLRQSGRALPRQALYDRFSGPGIVAERLTALTASGYLRKDAQLFSLTAPGRRIARLFQWLKGAWRLGPGG